MWQGAFQMSVGGFKKFKNSKFILIVELSLKGHIFEPWNDYP